MLNVWKDIYQYREFLKNNVSKDLRTRYRGSIFGFLWTFLNPLFMLVVYSTLFSIIIKMPVDNYPIFLFCTLLAWNNFQSSVQSSASIIVNSGNLIKKVYFPHEILPISVVTGGLINYLYGLVILIPALIIFGYMPNLNYLWLPVIIIIQFIFTLAISFIVSALNVYFRDLEHMLNIFLMAFLYLTPVLYPQTMIPEKYQWLFNWNPMAILVTAYRNVFYYNEPPATAQLFILGFISVVLLLFSQLYFKKVKVKFNEEI
ncbi:ABC-2 type transport system permease protein [Paenibacillus algorifonticola]|uniref:Transport permease protein n=1 Tax=Paenibacillus algorifonticola TaxID=684063 RepID=A0A1I2E171_9BACL|nr:ABC transporter permease [Paenibacillus algorifonticola]SFE86291.1 ABC-2 type transport system permease protein [Paenibacillus algorifonticola]